MEHFVTLFDAGFLPQGLALYRSLERHCSDFQLWVLCIDDKAFEVLERLALPKMRLVRLSDVETPALLAARADRTTAEYCWTLTPFSIDFVFAAEPDAKRVTYLDADMWMIGDPSPVFRELDGSSKAVLITEHAYAPDYDSSATTGRFCVQFMVFTRASGENVRRWWADRCLEWCYARIEDGKFGDQKYLDDWERRFPHEVHRLRQTELLLAPWNASRFPYGGAVAYHFHGLRLLNRRRVLLSRGYEIPKVVTEAIYGPYLEDLALSCDMLVRVGHVPPVQARRPGLFEISGVIFRKLQRLVAKLRPLQIKALPPVYFK